MQNAPCFAQIKYQTHCMAASFADSPPHAACNPVAVFHVWLFANAFKN
jgi:hypothetical protein